METENSTEIKTKVCKMCGRELPVSEFNKHSKTKDGLQIYCKECATKYVIASRQKKHSKLFLQYAKDEELVAELRNRGFVVKASKSVEL